MLLFALLTSVLVVAPAQARTWTQLYSGPHFGDGNIPPGCEQDMDRTSPRFWGTGEGDLTTPASTDSLAICHHQRTGQNGLDSPQVDVLVLVPVTEPERTMRLGRQAVQMWEDGIDYLAEGMGLQWLADGVDFHISVDRFDPLSPTGEFTTYPLLDPEIVVVMAANPSYLGIGIDPLTPIVGINGESYPDGNGIPCYGLQNPFDITAWEALPGWDSHHESRSGVYNEDCGGSGGNVCFAVNTAMDTELRRNISMFDLVAHEVGHCLSVGHVGDGAEGGWGGLPPNDIMAYDEGILATKCVSTLNVESFAIRMSRYLDVDGNGQVDQDDVLVANDATGGGYHNVANAEPDGDPFHTMHPRDYFYASSTGRAEECPQPDDGQLPGEPTAWTPSAEEEITEELLTITGPAQTVNETGSFTITGTVEERDLYPDPPVTNTSFVPDVANDASTPTSELLSLGIEVTETDVLATLDVVLVQPVTDGSSESSYRLTVNGWNFDTFLYGVGFGEPRVLDSNGTHDGEGWSNWDSEDGLVHFAIPREYLAEQDIQAPYEIGASAWKGNLILGAVRDDSVPNGSAVTVIGPEGGAAATPTVLDTVDGGASLRTETFVHEDADLGDNTFWVDEASFAETFLFAGPSSTAHVFQLDLGSEVAAVDFELTWTDLAGTVAGDADPSLATVTTTDLDLYVSPGGTDQGGNSNQVQGMGEVVHLDQATGVIDLWVEPYFIGDVFVTYTLVAEITPITTGEDTDQDGIIDALDRCPSEPGPAVLDGCPDTDGDGVADLDDRCPTEPGPVGGCPDADGDGVADLDDLCPDEFGEDRDGCPIAATEFVQVRQSGQVVASTVVDTVGGSDAFEIPLYLSDGVHELEVVWVNDGHVMATSPLTLTHDDDDDDDGVLNSLDNCPSVANGDQADLDADGLGDACDPDVDGDGVANDDDVCHGFDDLADLDEDGIPDGCDTDVDGDGVGNDVDNCVEHANADQADLDGDSKGDACDPDRDGDGHNNNKEAVFGTDPDDATSYPAPGSQPV